MMIPLSRGTAVEDQPICAVIRGMGVTKFADAAMCRALIAINLPEDKLVVHSLAEVADAFAISAATVKNHWRESGMPGKSGRWDLSEILSWRLTRDARGRGDVIDDTPIAVQVDRVFTALAEEWGIERIIEGGKRLAKRWDDTLAECEAEETRATRSRRKIPTRKEIL